LEGENLMVKLAVNGTEILSLELVLYEEVPDEQDMVLIEIMIDGQKINAKSESFFNALLELRKELEKRSIQIMCNGAAENVYPSPMQLSMGVGRIAYKQYLGQQARKSDIVDIFDCDNSLNFVSIEAQLRFHNDWLGCATNLACHFSN
jgi:hypothetical protein